ncbi:MAG: Uma2 family endonuclease [Anaerolineae bacterium]
METRTLEKVEETVKEKPAKKMTFEEFLDWCDEDTLAEWVDGEVIMYSPAARKHQDIVGFLFELLNSYVSLRGLGQVLLSPFIMRLETRPSGREPDLLFIAKENLARLKETYLNGPADLVVEVTSEESASRDRGEKFYEYEAAGVKEYWLLDPERERAEFYQLDEKRRFKALFPDEEGIYRSGVLPGFWMRVSWLWESTLPSTIRVLAEIAGVEPSMAEAFEKAIAGSYEK